MMSKNTHFEDLWEMCETFHKNSEGFTQPLDLDELIMKIGLYQSFAKKTNISTEELQKVKSRVLGEILFFLTNLSVRDNVDVFNALLIALKSRQVT
jgi:hypothetical protein